MRALLLSLSLFVVAPLACAGVITFEGYDNQMYDAPIIRLELEIGNPVGQEQHFHEITSTSYGLPSNGTGVLLNDRDTQIYFIPATGASFTSFNLYSVDVATATGNGPATDLVITGYLLGSPTGSISLPIDGTWVTVGGAPLGTVDRIVFDGTGDGGGFVLDNFDFGTEAGVPEPSSFLLASLGIGLLAAALRKR